MYGTCECRIRTYLPHNDDDDAHDDLVQNVEKLDHDSSVVPHAPHNHSKDDTEANQP